MRVVGFITAITHKQHSIIPSQPNTHTHTHTHTKIFVTFQSPCLATSGFSLQLTFWPFRTEVDAFKYKCDQRAFCVNQLIYSTRRPANHLLDGCVDKNNSYWQDYAEANVHSCLVSVVVALRRCGHIHTSTQEKQT